MARAFKFRVTQYEESPFPHSQKMAVAALKPKPEPMECREVRFGKTFFPSLYFCCRFFLVGYSWVTVDVGASCTAAGCVALAQAVPTSPYRETLSLPTPTKGRVQIKSAASPNKSFSPTRANPSLASRLAWPSFLAFSFSENYRSVIFAFAEFSCPFCWPLFLIPFS